MQYCIILTHDRGEGGVKVRESIWEEIERAVELLGRTPDHRHSHYIILYYFILHYITLYYIILYYIKAPGEDRAGR